MEAARVAPTACNFQPQRILVLDNKESLEKLKKCTPYHFHAPLALVVCYDKTTSWKRKDGDDMGEVDAAIVTTQMMLETENIGLGTTWVGYFDKAELVKEFEAAGLSIDKEKGIVTYDKTKYDTAITKFAKNNRLSYLSTNEDGKAIADKLAKDGKITLNEDGGYVINGAEGKKAVDEAFPTQTQAPVETRENKSVKINTEVTTTTTEESEPVKVADDLKHNRAGRKQARKDYEAALTEWVKDPENQSTMNISIARNKYEKKISKQMGKIEKECKTKEEIVQKYLKEYATDEEKVFFNTLLNEAVKDEDALLEAYKRGTGDGQALLGVQIGCHSTDDGIIAVSGEGVVLEVNTGDHHVFVSIYSYTCHAGSGIFPSRHAAVEGGAISLNRDQGCRWIGIALFNSHIADRSAWIKIDDAGVFGTTFQRAARQRDSAFISEEAGPCNLVDGDLDAFVDIDVAVIKDQIVERGILLISSILNGCGRPCCPVFDGQRHFRNFKLRVGVSTIHSNIYCCIYTGTRCWFIIVKIDISINSNSRFSRFIKGNNSISSGKESILCFYMKISINFYDAIRHGNNSAVCCFDISIFCIYCYASAFIDRNSITIC